MTVYARALAVMLLLQAASTAHAAPVLHVRARTRLVLEAINRSPTGARIAVRLVEAISGEPLPRRAIAIAIEGAGGTSGFYRYAEPTDWGGRVEFRAPLTAGTYELRIAAGSDAEHAAPDPLNHTLDLGRRQACLQVSAPPALAIDATSLPVTIMATDCELLAGYAPPADVPYRIEVDGVGVATGEIIGGRTTVEVPGHRLGPVGRNVELKVTLVGDARFAERSQTLTVALLAPSQISLDEATRTDATYRVTGLLRAAAVESGSGTIELSEEDSPDKPLRSQPIAAAGAFSLETVALSEGVHRLRVRFVPHSSLLLGSTSDTKIVVVRAPLPLPWLWPPALALCVGAALPLLRRRRTTGPVSRDRARPMPVGRPTTTGTRLLVRDATRQAPLRVTVETNLGTFSTNTDGFVEVDAATTFIHCAPPGYLPRRLELGPRMQGILTLDLVSLREHVYAAFLEAAQRLGRGVALDGQRATPRQILALVSQKTLVMAPLPELAVALERLYFGLPHEEALQLLAERLAAVAPTTPLDPGATPSL